MDLPTDPPEYISYADHSSVDYLLEPLRNMQKEIAKMQEIAKTDPNAAYQAFLKNHNTMTNTVYNIEVNAGDSSRHINNRIEELGFEYQDVFETVPSDSSEVHEYLKNASEVLNAIDDLIIDYAEEIGEAGAEADAEFLNDY